MKIIEYRECFNCTQCRGNEKDGWYCHRTYAEICPKSSACDDFEDNENN